MRHLLLAAALFVAGSFLMTEPSYANEPAPNKGGGDRVSGAAFATRSPVLATHGMAATSHPLASQIAIDIMKDGGNAVDAAIAANAALGLMEPTGNGIGGDLFAIIWDPKSKELYGLNASGRAPAGQSLGDLREKIAKSGLDDRYWKRDPANGEGTDMEIPNWGSYSVTVPGTVDGWFTMHEKFGTKPMTDILAPTIEYARQGFPVTQLIGHYLGRSKGAFERLHKAGVIEEIDNYKATYLIDGEAPKEGDIFKNPDLAKTLETIGKGGRDAFYDGPLTDVIEAYFKRIGGPLRKSDFAAQTSNWVTPAS
ncbi:MAG: gamma-glutamyltransferase, partial [Pseudomonadota bacterium]